MATPAMDHEKSLGDGATFAGAAKRLSADELSIGDERTLGAPLGDQDTVIDDIEVVDLEARYKVEGMLGRGGMGEVLLAVDTRLDRRVAIKRILGEAARNKTAINRFITEAKAIAALNHPNIVQIYDYGRAKDGPFLIMEYVDGSSLLNHCREGALPLHEAVDLACQLCDGLGKAHNLGIVHRDIKPANVLLTKDGVPKLTDFGLAKAETSDHQMTMTGAVIGTPDFMSPEQRRDAAEVDARSDLWSLAATVYQMVTGRSPKIIRFDLLPASLTSVMGRALEDRKDDRFQSVREFRDALKGSLVALAPAMQELDAGECPSCGVSNEARRKFCRNCAQSLEAPCLSCNKPMPYWEAICGECGSRQSDLVEARRKVLLSQQAEAEALLKQNDFEQASLVAKQLQTQGDPRLKEFATWATGFHEQIEKTKESLLTQILRRHTEADKHESAFDYPAAIKALEQIAESLRDHAVPGTADTPATALARVRHKQSECQRLEQVIATRLSNHDLGGLLEQVNSYRQLRPDRQDLIRLAEQLQAREQSLINEREQAVIKANAALGSKDYATALHALSKVDSSVETPLTAELRKTAANKSARITYLLHSIHAAVTETKLDGLLSSVEEALQHRPNDGELLTLKEKLLARERRLDAEIELVISRAEADFQKRKFQNVEEALKRIPESRRTAPINQRISAAEQLTILRAIFRDAVRALPQIQDLAEAKQEVSLSQIANHGRAYLAALTENNLQDPQAEAWCQKLEVANAKRFAAWEHEQRAVQRKNIAVGLLGLTAVGVCALCVSVLARQNTDSQSRPRRNLTGTSSLTPETGRPAPEVTPSLARDTLPNNRMNYGQPDQKTQAIPSNSNETDLSEHYINSIGMNFRSIRPGIFTIGDSLGRDDEQPRVITIDHGFYIGTTEVTNAQWVKIMNTEPSNNPAPFAPVDNVSWNEAQEFCQRLSLLPEERKHRLEYHLPTEAEWECACRAETTTSWAFGQSKSEVAPLIFHAANSRGASRTVTSGRPNSFGLYAMHGNIAEWCEDFYARDSSAGNGVGVANDQGNALKAVRGGSFLSSIDECRSSCRAHELPSTKRIDLGFRVVMTNTP